jgi:hypothetical protein
MSLWLKLRGTIETIVQIGLGGPNLKNNAGAIEARNATDTGFAIARGATPIAANDLVTKAYADAGDLGVGGGVQEIRVAVALATVSSVAGIPIGAIVVDAELDVTTLYSGGATISLGQAGAVAEFQATTDNLPQALGLYQVHQDTAAASTNPLLVTVAGAPAAGAAQAIIRYVVTPQV